MYQLLKEWAEEMATDATLTLTAKLQALGQVARACGLSRDHLELAKTKTRRGHHEHGDAETVDLAAELRAELADVAGYGALCWWRGLWTGDYGRSWPCRACNGDSCLTTEVVRSELRCPAGANREATATGRGTRRGRVLP